MAKTPKPKSFEVRPLAPDDLDRVVEIDQELAGRSRRGFYDRRLRGASREHASFLYLGISKGDQLIGFVLARLLEGEFGTKKPTAVLDAIGVEYASHGTGAGKRLMAELEEILRLKGVSELRSQLDWNNHALMRFLDSAGFELAPRVIMSRRTEQVVF